MGVPSDLEISIPEGFKPDEDCTVYKVELTDPLKLNLGKGRS